LGIDTLNIAPGEALTVAQGFVNSGTIQINSDSSLTVESFGTMRNYGSIDVNNGGTLTLVAPPGSQTREARGTIELNSTGSLTILRLEGDNAGFSTATPSYIRLSDSANNLITGVTGTETLDSWYRLSGAGSITNLHLALVGSGGSVTATGQNPLIITPNSQGVSIGNSAGLGAASGSTLIVNGLVTNDRGFIDLEANGRMIINGPVNNASGVFIGSSASLTTGNFTNSGYVDLNLTYLNQSGPNGGTFAVNGDLNNSGTVGMLGSSLVSVSGDLNNTGTVSLGSSDTVRVGGSFINGTSGILTLQQSGGTVITGQFNNAGTVQVGTGNNLILNGGQPFTSTAGQVVVDGNLISPGGVNIQGGTLSGTGMVDGNVTMAGVMSPGDAPGTFTINGNYTQTSTGTLLEQVGWINGGQASLLRVNGTADLDGTLVLMLLNGYDPTAGDSFILMTFWCDYGSFNTVTGLNLGNDLFFNLIYDPHDIRVVVESQPVATPEPNSIILLLVGCIPILAISRKRLAAKIANMPGTAS